MHRRTQHENLVTTLKLAQANPDKLTPWDQEFIDSLSDRLGKYGRDTFLTPRQWEQLNRLQEKLS